MAASATKRVIAVGDLNGAYDVLLDLLRGTGLVNRRLEWSGKRDAGGPHARRQLRETLALVGAQRMVVGHSQTASLPRGREGRILVAAAGRLIDVDVGLNSEQPRSSAALIIEGERGYEWTPDGTTQLWSRRGNRIILR